MYLWKSCIIVLTKENYVAKFWAMLIQVLDLTDCCCKKSCVVANNFDSGDATWKILKAFFDLSKCNCRSF